MEYNTKLETEKADKRGRLSELEAKFRDYEISGNKFTKEETKELDELRKARDNDELLSYDQLTAKEAERRSLEEAAKADESAEVS